MRGKISPENLASQLEVAIQRLRLGDLRALLPLQILQYAQAGEASLDVGIASVGLRKVKASVGGSTGPIVLARHGTTATVELRRLNAGITYEAGALQADVEQLELGAPQLKGSGTFKIQPGALSARVNVRGVDIAEVGNLALQIAGDVEAVKKALRYFPAGTIPEMTIQSAGPTFTEMAASQNIVLSGMMRNGTIVIPGSELELQNVSGSVRILQGNLEAKNVSAEHGTMKGWNGVLRLGLDGRTAPFHLDLAVRTGGLELQAVLLKLVRNETFRAELLKVQSLEGELSGKLILGERLDALAPVVILSKADISATYAPIPFPITIRGGQLNYDQKAIRLEHAQGSVGRSNVEELAVTFQRDGTRQIAVESRRVSLDLQETETLLRNFKDLPPQFAKWQSARGQIELRNLTLGGAYDDFAGWTFASAGRFDRVEITHADLPGRISLSRGNFDAKQGQIKFSGAVWAVSDASLTVAGSVEYQSSGAVQFDISGMGTIGAQMTEWLSRHFELPEGLRLRSPLNIADGRFTRRGDGDLSFRGQVTVAGGPQLSLDLMKQPQRFAVRNLTIEDGGRRGRMTFQVAKNKLDLSFNGELMEQTIDRIFASFPMKGTSLRGAIEINAGLEKPVRVSAQGQLSGSNLLIPLGTENALLEKFSVEASGDSVQVRSAELRWGRSRLTVSGKVISAKDVLRVDVDVIGDQLDWQELQQSFAVERKLRHEENGGSNFIPAVEGTVRLKTNRLSFERFNLSPLELKAVITPSGIRAEIERAVVCGINATGRVAFAGKEIEVDLQLGANDAQLEPATVCVTSGSNDIKGIYSLKARLAGRGDREHLLPSLKGSFEISARDGEFVRAPATDATFDYLNGTGDFKFAFPDLDKETFPYRLVRVRGQIDGEVVVGDEIIVQSSSLNLTGRARIDLAHKQVDGKGIVAVLKPVDEVLSRIPVVSTIFGGSLLGIPVRVAGALSRPQVTYLSPADVGAELLNVPMRILGIPMEAIKLFRPGDGADDKNVPD
jgi:hypothetical protein